MKLLIGQSGNAIPTNIPRLEAIPFSAPSPNLVFRIYYVGRIIGRIVISGDTQYIFYGESTSYKDIITKEKITIEEICERVFWDQL